MILFYYFAFLRSSLERGACASLSSISFAGRELQKWLSSVAVLPRPKLRWYSCSDFKLPPIIVALRNSFYCHSGFSGRFSAIPFKRRWTEHPTIIHKYIDSVRKYGSRAKKWTKHVWLSFLWLDYMDTCTDRRTTEKWFPEPTNTIGSFLKCKFSDLKPMQKIHWGLNKSKLTKSIQTSFYAAILSKFVFTSSSRRTGKSSSRYGFRLFYSVINFQSVASPGYES